MIQIKNTSKEPWELLTHIEHAHQLAGGPGPQRIEPGQTICIVGYQPGVRYEIRPVQNFDEPRSAFA